MLSRVQRLVLFNLVAAAVAAQAQTDPLTGRWRSSQTSASEISTVFEFNAGELHSYSAVLFTQTYRLLGTDTILLKSKDTREEKQELEWDNPGHARIEDEAAGKKIELTRIGTSPDRQHPLVGEWRTSREWNGRIYPARAIVSLNGTVVWITELRGEHGRYSVEDRTIRLEVLSRPPVSGTFVLEGDRLTLPNPNGGQSSFERF